MGLREVSVAAIIPCMHTSLQGDFVASPIKRWRPFPLESGWPVTFFNQQKVV